jgi:hypothetical protein
MKISVWFLPMTVLTILIVDTFPAAGAEDSNPAKAKSQDAVKEEVPSQEDQDKVEASLKELFPREYASKKASLRLALALNFYRKGIETTDNPPERFVLFREARDLAIKALQPEVALGAIEALDQGFRVKALEMKTAALEKIGTAARTSGARRLVVEAAILVVDEAVAADNYQAAGRLSKLAQEMANKIKSKSLTTLVEAHAEELSKLRKDFPAVQAAREKLKSAPDDPKANLKVGKYECLVQGNWQTGLARLAKGSDEKLKKMAEALANKPAKPEELVAAGNHVWDWAEREEDSAKRKLQERARAWYWQALPELTGLAKTRVEKRLQLGLGKVVLKPGLVAQMFNDTKFERPVKAGLHYQVDFNWNKESPDPDINRENFGVRWWGYLKPPRLGLYMLRIKCDNGSRLWIGKAAVINKLDTNGVYDLPVRLVLSDKPQPILLEFHQGVGEAYIHFSWIPPGAIVEVPIPPSAFYHSVRQEKLLGR